MNLIIDAGNTAVKTAIFDEGELIFKEIYAEENTVSALTNLRENYPNISKAIISSVSSFNDEYINEPLLGIDVFKLSHTSKFPFHISYRTPTTLGIDRLALASAAVSQYGGVNVLVIDAGTCVTYDFVNSNNRYMGGAISPGLQLRYNSLNNFTANLPLLQPETPKSIIGNSTEQSIHSGVVNGLILEIDGAIDTYRKIYGDLTVILTGGDCNFLSNQLKNSIFANSNFLLEGLNFILEYNTIK